MARLPRGCQEVQAKSSGKDIRQVNNGDKRWGLEEGWKKAGRSEKERQRETSSRKYLLKKSSLLIH